MIKASDSSGQSTGDAKFGIGQIVEHRRYGYRGVIVEFDTTCQAGAQWYYSNQTQPDRNQAWYHVLVDGAAHTTYAAEENLQPAADLAPVSHPLVEQFFDEFADGRYVRNSHPWPWK